MSAATPNENENENKNENIEGRPESEEPVQPEDDGAEAKNQVEQLNTPSPGTGQDQPVDGEPGYKGLPTSSEETDEEAS